MRGLPRGNPEFEKREGCFKYQVAYTRYNLTSEGWNVLY